MPFLWSKKPPFEKTASSTDKMNVSLTEKKACKIFGIFDKNHGLSPSEKCKFFDYRQGTFLLCKKPPFEKTTSSNDKTKKGSFERYLEFLTRIMG